MKHSLGSTTLRLTAWYLVIIMLISLVFSMVIFQLSDQALRRSLPRGGGPGQRALITDPEQFEIIRTQLADSSREELLRNLILLNLIMLVGGGGASYLLARRTLTPIHEALDAQSRFTSDASHELRTPLTAMRTEMEVALRDAGATKTELKQTLESNLEEVVSLQALSDNLLHLTSDSPLIMEPVSLDAVTDEALHAVRSLLKQKHITIDNQINSHMVSGNKDSLVQLVVILLDNAIKYSDPKSQITLSSLIQGKLVTLQVTDQGRGMSATDTAHVFERFYRASSSRSSSQVAGHGLGLSIAQRIAEKHDTTIEVTSELGVGSTFKTSLATAKSE